MTRRMTHLNKIFLAVPGALVLFLSGCSHAADQAIAQQVTRPGVFALTKTGLVEIQQYGAYALDPFSQEITFKFDQSIPQIAAVMGFVTNIPNAAITESKVFLLPTMEAGRWHKLLVAPDDSKPIESSADAISGAIYKVIPDSLPDPATGFLCLLVKMPAGSNDRLYAVHLK
jgi:hypothetical protein